MTCWHMKRMLIYCYSFRHVDKLFFGGSALGLLFLGPAITPGGVFLIYFFFRTCKSSSSETGFKIISLKNMLL